jgi:hypothetical protein
MQKKKLVSFIFINDSLLSTLCYPARRNSSQFYLLIYTCTHYVHVDYHARASATNGPTPHWDLQGPCMNVESKSKPFLRARRHRGPQRARNYSTKKTCAFKVLYLPASPTPDREEGNRTSGSYQLDAGI